MIQFLNVSKVYDSGKGIRNLTFSVEKNNITGVIGPNGCGKTTIFRILNKLLDIDEGKIIIDNINLKSYDLNKIGYLPEEKSLYPNAQSYEMLRFSCELKGIKGKDKEDKIDKIINKFKIKEILNRKIYELSKGNKQLIALGCAMVHEPELLILDEPFTGLDFNNQELFEKVLKEYKDNHYLLISLHEKGIMERICEKSIIINERGLINA